jgi:transposase
MDKDKVKLATNIGKTKKLLEAGYSITEISIKLGKNESTIRSWAKMIDDAKLKKN